MHVTACLAKQEVDVAVDEDCRTIQALKDAIVVALPQLRVGGFDVSVGGRVLAADEDIIALDESVRLDLSANTRDLSVMALREAGREVSEAGLLRAAEEGDVSLCALYLDAGVPIDCVSTDGLLTTPLFLACENEKLEVATLLLDRGSTVIDKVNSCGDTPLHRACFNGHLELVTLLLDRGSTAIDEGREHTYGYTPINTACRLAYFELAKLLLERGAYVDSVGENNNTSLHIACEDNDQKFVKLLLDHGSGAVNEENCTGLTPFLIACQGGDLTLVTLLLKHGGNVYNPEDVFEGEEEPGFPKRELYSDEMLKLLADHGVDVPALNPAPNAKRRRTCSQ